MKKRFKVSIIILLSTVVCLSFIHYLPLPKDISFDNVIHRETLSIQASAKRVIPRIIHHTWIDEDIPSKWQSSYEECKRKYPEYDFRLWTDKKSRGFVEQEFPEYLEMFTNYNYPIQRADVIRYFVLYKYGGIYMDLDIGCADLSLDTLLPFDAVVPQTKPFGFSNDMLAAKPGHEFFKLLIIQLPKWDHWYVFPYLTVFCSTGPLYLSIQHSYYRGLDVIWTLDVDLYSDGAEKIFKHYEGSTWHSWDAWAVKKIWRYVWELSFLAFVGVVMVLRFRRIRSSKRIKINCSYD
jgi:inositol phosphorylceramide mannosyltransferase catalytic subunit